MRVPLETMPQWEGLSALELRAARRALRSSMDATEREMELVRQKSRTRVRSVASLINADPRTRPREARQRTQQPWAFGAREAVWALRDAYRNMVVF